MDAREKLAEIFKRLEDIRAREEQELKACSRFIDNRLDAIERRLAELKEISNG